jgi:hypothetical protein
MQLLCNHCFLLSFLTYIIPENGIRFAMKKVLSDRLMSGQTPCEILRRARQRLSDPSRWTQRAPARTSSGAWCKPGDKEAVCWDIEGAVAIECNKYGIISPTLLRLLDAYAEPYGLDSIGGCNDFFSHAKVLDFLKEVAEAVGAEEEKDGKG